jgi:hypothetical protein
VYQLRNGVYVISSYDGLFGGWTPSDPVIEIGEGFWTRKRHPGQWTVSNQDTQTTAFVRLNIPPGFSVIANPLATPDPSVKNLAVPDGTTLYFFDVSHYNRTTYNAAHQAWEPAFPDQFDPGKAAIIKNVTDQPFSLTFSGQLPTGTISISLPIGFSLNGAPVPKQGPLIGLNFPQQDGDSVYLMKNGTFVVTVFDALAGAWLPFNPVLKVGEGFWFRSNRPEKTWVINASSGP